MASNDWYDLFLPKIKWAGAKLSAHGVGVVLHISPITKRAKLEQAFPSRNPTRPINTLSLQVAAMCIVWRCHGPSPHLGIYMFPLWMGRHFWRDTISSWNRKFWQSPFPSILKKIKRLEEKEDQKIGRNSSLNLHWVPIPHSPPTNGADLGQKFLSIYLDKSKWKKDNLF